MKTENEIIALSLVERQKLYVELKQVQTNDKDFAASRAIIELIAATEDWEEPKLEDVTAKESVIIDGKNLKKGESSKVYPWQFKALARYLKPSAAFAGRLKEERDADLAAQKATAAEQKPEKAAVTNAAAALIAFIIGLAFLCQTASAQVQTYLVGTQGQYNVQTIAGLNGGTNNVVGTNATFAAGTIVTNTAVVPSWSSVNGAWTNAPSTNVTSVVTNVPGVVSVVNYDSFGLQLSFALQGAGTTVTSSSWDISGDGINWQTNAFQLNAAATGTSQVTVYTNMIQVQYGYFRLNTIWNPAATGTGDNITNLFLTVIKKSNRQGP